MQGRQPHHAQGADRFAWIDPGVSVWDQWGAVPPPPKLGPSIPHAPSPAPPPTPNAPQTIHQPQSEPQPQPEPEDEYAPPPPTTPTPKPAAANTNPPTFHEFDAELDVAELDDRLRPTTWSARARTVNRSSLSFRSRRMCYPKSILLMAVHLIDDKPTVLAGRVTTCEYAGEGLYLVEAELMPKPDTDDIRQWEAQR